MASVSAPANELPKQLPASASILLIAVPPPAASTAEAVDLSVRRGRDPWPAAAAAAAAAAASTRAGFLSDKKAERGGYMHQVFILSHLPLVYMLSPSAVWSCRRYFMCTYWCMG